MTGQKVWLLGSVGQHIWSLIPASTIRAGSAVLWLPSQVGPAPLRLLCWVGPAPGGLLCQVGCFVRWAALSGGRCAWPFCRCCQQVPLSFARPDRAGGAFMAELAASDGLLALCLHAFPACPPGDGYARPRLLHLINSACSKRRLSALTLYFHMSQAPAA